MNDLKMLLDSTKHIQNAHPLIGGANIYRLASTGKGTLDKANETTAVLLIPNYNPSFDQSMPVCLFLDPADPDDKDKHTIKH